MIEDRIEYDAKSYRLSESVIEKLNSLKHQERVTFNQLFNKLIESYGDSSRDISSTEV